RQVYCKAASLGLKKTPEYLASPKSGRTNGNQGKATRFKKGMTPWNKGKPGSTGLHPNSRRTQFKPGELQGRAAEIAQPIGAERLSKEGYLERKINNDPPFHRRWRAVHILAWEQANGPVP